MHCKHDILLHGNFPFILHIWQATIWNRGLTAQKNALSFRNEKYYQKIILLQDMWYVFFCNWTLQCERERITTLKGIFSPVRFCALCLGIKILRMRNLTRCSLYFLRVIYFNLMSRKSSKMYLLTQITVPFLEFR